MSCHRDIVWRFFHSRKKQSCPRAIVELMTNVAIIKRVREEARQDMLTPGSAIVSEANQNLPQSTAYDAILTQNNRVINEYLILLYSLHLLSDVTHILLLIMLLFVCKFLMQIHYSAKFLLHKFWFTSITQAKILYKSLNVCHPQRTQVDS